MNNVGGLTKKMGKPYPRIFVGTKVTSVHKVHPRRSKPRQVAEPEREGTS